MLDRLFGRRRRRRSQQPMTRPDSADAALERYFTNAEAARQLFEQRVAADHLERRILVVYGAGAVGKSSLLKMYRLSCRRRDVPVALAAAEEAPSVVDMLARWSGDMEAGGVALGRLQNGLNRYRDLLSKVSAAASNAGFLKPDVAGQATSFLASGIVVGTAGIPGLGNVTAAIGPERIEELLTVIRQTLTRDDYAFFTDPTTSLTKDFLADIHRSARDRRVVLMLDSFEQATAQSAWLRELAQGFPGNLLFVIAGREIPAWDRGWPGWAAYRTDIELTELSDQQIETLVRRYYALYDRGEPDGSLVKEAVRFARGLPMAAATVVELSVSYHVADFRPTAAGVAAELADKMLEDVPAEIRPALEVAAALRYFNADSLSTLLEMPDASALYDELRRLPFTRGRSEGFAVHDTMRELICDALKARSPQRFRSLNERAAGFYEGLLEHSVGEERERVQRERLYHLIRTEEEAGIRDFRDLAEGLVRAQWLGRLRALGNDVNSYPLAGANSRLWRRYYAARLEQLDGHTAAAQEELTAIATDSEAEPTLRAYALCDLGGILATLDRLAAPGGEGAALSAVERSLALQPVLDSKLVANHYTRMKISNARADWDESIRHVGEAREFARANDDAYALVTADRLRAGLYGLQGDWPGYVSTRRQYMDVLSGLGDVPALRMNVAYFTWPLTLMGRCAEALASSEEALALAVRLEERELMITIRESIGLTRGMQDAYAEAAVQFRGAYDFYEQFHLREPGGAPERYIRGLLSFRGLVALREGRLDDAEADLQQALDIKRGIGDRIGTPELHVWRGQLHELRSAWDRAEDEYAQTLELRGLGRNYFNCAALAGLVRVRVAQRRSEGCEQLIAEATELGTRFGYNDLLASVRLCQGHLAWDASESGTDAAADHYRLALVFAMRFNRFLLDEVLGGRLGGTPHYAVIPACVNRGDRGLRALSELRDWWATGTNGNEAEIQTVSLLRAGVPLLEAERTARERELGTGLPQRTVTEQIRSALADA